MSSITNLHDNDRYCIIFQVDDQSNISLFQLEAFKHSNQQTILFPNPLINYLLTTSTLKVFLKLIGSCKFLYLYKKITVIPNVHVHFTLMNSSYFDQTKVIKLYSNELSKLWITEMLQTEYHGQSFPHALSKFCLKIFKCQARYISINRQRLTEEEFRFLIQPQFVESLNIGLTLIKKSDGNFMTVEEISERVPNAILLDFWALPNTYQTLFNLSMLSRNKKLQSFRYYPNREKDMDFHLKFNVEIFTNFVTKNAAPNAVFDICFGYSSHVTNKSLEIAKNKIKHFTKAWIPQEQKPVITLGTQNRYPSLDDILEMKEQDDILQPNNIY